MSINNINNIIDMFNKPPTEILNEVFSEINVRNHTDRDLFIENTTEPIEGKEGVTLTIHIHEKT
jgi:hypothetical protein